MFNRIGIIGVGRIGCAIANGLLRAGYQSKQLTLLVKRDEQKLSLLQYKFHAYTNINDLQNVDALILAVDHKDIPALLKTIQSTFTVQAKPIISVATQFTYHQFQQILGDNYPVFRVMPNAFVQVNQGCLLFCPNPNFNELTEAVENLLAYLGKVFYVKEECLIRSLCDFSSIPGVIITKLLLERINSVENSEKQLTEELLFAGLKGLIANIEHLTKQNSSTIKQALEYTLLQIVSPGGFSNAALTSLTDQNFWDIFKKAVEVYQKGALK